MDALYSSESLTPRWWDKMSEMAFLAMTSPAWTAGSVGQGLDAPDDGGEDLALQPPCIGVDVLLQFYEESIVLDIRPRASFECSYLNKAINVTPKDVSELICLLKEGQATLPDPKGVQIQIQKFGSSRPLISKMARAASGASSLEAFQALTADTGEASTGFAAAESQEAAQARGGGGHGPPPTSLKPWVSPTMSRLPLIVVVGDKEDCGSGLARRLLTAGVACVCVLLGGIDALHLDAPNDFLTRKPRK
ncbi:hypothetical protein EPH_0003190 [Eimeria praecox]|uniref:Rhodanese domain-containing protein n=1 Tax=Eimeria praecox TaxID=51316 RepID=U6G3B3_9EIME|nr:hypothetical protein EPH_0003190 [Eimeria praecox]